MLREMAVLRSPGRRGTEPGLNHETLATETWCEGLCEL
jgi:hypothetical protein